LNWADDFISSVIGTGMAIVFISLLGGKIAAAWTDLRFNRKWQSYRHIAADEIEARFKTYYNQTLPYFSTYLKDIAEKQEKEISTFDYDLFTIRREEVVRGLRLADRIFESYHFCLRGSDVERGQHFIIAVKRDLRLIEERRFLPLNNFGSMLSTHLQGRYGLSEEIPSLHCTRHEFMLACSRSVEEIVGNHLDGDVLNRLYIFTGGLRQPGSAEPDARERLWLAEPLPPLKDERAKKSAAEASE
jgi:hypothetical protein